MIKPKLDPRHAAVRYKSYVVGFCFSVIITMMAYGFVVNDVWPKEIMIYVVMSLAIVQLIVQLIFFLHLGRGNTWKLVTFFFALLVVLVVVIGSLWIMNNLDYNMMHMSPDEMDLYMQQNEGI